MIKHYNVNIFKGGTKHDYSFNKNSFTITEMEILGENDSYIVFNDDWFTKISKKHDYTSSQLDKESISITTNDSLYGNSIRYNLYTTKNVRPSTIKNHIQKKISEKYGWLFNEVDLSIIK